VSASSLRGAEVYDGLCSYMFTSESRAGCFPIGSTVGFFCFRREYNMPAAKAATTATGTATPIPAFAPVDRPCEDWEAPVLGDEVGVGVLTAVVDVEIGDDDTEVGVAIDIEVVVRGSVKLKLRVYVFSSVPDEYSPVEGNSSQNWLDLVRFRLRISMVQLYDHLPALFPKAFVSYTMWVIENSKSSRKI
jgi:hypothetical protein